MCPSILRICCRSDAFISELCKIMKWEVVSQFEMDSSETTTKCTDNGNWKGFCLFIKDDGGNIRVENTSGCLGHLKQSHWIQLGKLGSLEYIEYNDSINYACYVKVEDGKIIDYYLYNEDEHEKIESGDLYASWIDVASDVDEDDGADFSGNGLAVILKAT
jgi:hypothetical protein